MEPLTLIIILFVYTALTCLPLVFSPVTAKQGLKALWSSPERMQLVGGIAAMLCILTLMDNIVPDWTPEGVARAIAWLGLIKGIALCWWPSYFVTTIERITKRVISCWFMGVCGIAVCVGYGYLISLLWV